MNFQGRNTESKAALSNEVIVIEHGTSTIKVLAARKDAATARDVLSVQPVVGKDRKKKTYFGDEAVRKCERRELRQAFEMENNGKIAVSKIRCSKFPCLQIQKMKTKKHLKKEFSFHLSSFGPSETLSFCCAY